MVRAVAGLAAAVAATAWAPQAAQAVSLREQLVQALDASAGLDKRAQTDSGDYISCKYNANDGDRDKFCEAYQSREAAPMNGCACREVCHVWGDPHLSPFYDTCSAYVMNSDGWHTLWELPERNGSPGMKIEAYVEMKKGNHWIQVLRVDDTEVMDVKTYCKSKDDDGNTFIRNSRMLKSDDALENGRPEDTKIEYTAYCDWKKKVASLEVSIVVEQTGSNRAVAMSNGRFGAPLPPPTTAMFATDTGMCTAPDGKFNCDRPSTIKANDKLEGRECTCNAQCSIFGDPHVHDFFKEQNKNGKSFKMPEESSMAQQNYHVGRALYMVDNKFAVYAKMNGCEHIEEIKILISKKADTPIGKSCGNAVGWEPEPRSLSLDDFDVLSYNANDLCKGKEAFQADTRKSIVFPFGEKGEKYLTEELGGYDLGLYGTFDDNDPNVRPYRSARISRQEQVRQCTLPNGHTADVNSYLDMGGVRVTMKCHRTKKKGKAKSTAFFNVCIERNDITDDATRSNTDLSKRAFDTAEKNLLTSGHCALGQSSFDDFASPVPRYTSTEYRALDEFNYFYVDEKTGKQLYPASEQ